VSGIDGTLICLTPKSAQSDVDQVEVFSRVHELPVKGRFAAFLER
jgi:hypothetical protein